MKKRFLSKRCQCHRLFVAQMLHEFGLGFEDLTVSHGWRPMSSFETSALQAFIWRWSIRTEEVYFLGVQARNSPKTHSICKNILEPSMHFRTLAWMSRGWKTWDSGIGKDWHWKRCESLQVIRCHHDSKLRHAHSAKLFDLKQAECLDKILI